MMRTKQFLCLAERAEPLRICVDRITISKICGIRCEKSIFLTSNRSNLEIGSI